MPRWEYCKIIQPVDRSDGPPSPATVWFLGTTKDETRTLQTGLLDCELARLGSEGWELVSHTQAWGVLKGEASGTLVPAPAFHVYYLKRLID